MIVDVIKEYNILLENLYNMNEKGIQLGISVRITAIVDRDQQTVYSLEDGNRELVTIIKTICADGSILHPSVIFQRQWQNPEWGCNNPCNLRFVFISFPFQKQAFLSLPMVGQTKSWVPHGFEMILIL